MARAGSSSWGKLMVMAMLVISVAGGRPSSPSKPPPRQQSCDVYHPRMKGRVGHNDKGTVCCPLGCGQCGGIDCRKNLPRGLSGKDCCVTGVLQSQGRCSDRGAKAPCIIKGGPKGKPSRPTKPSPPKKKPSRPKKKPSRPKKQPSRPKKQPSRPKKQPSRPKKKPSRPKRQPSRPKKQPSRPKKQPSPPKKQPSRPKKKPSRPKKRPSRPKKKPSPPKKRPSRPKKKPSPPKKKPSPPKKKPSPPKKKPSQTQKSCHVYYPGMKGRVGHNDKGMVCCPLGCGECGGIGCGKNLPRGLSGEDCCVTGVLESQGLCSHRGAKAPCIIKRPIRRTGRHKKRKGSKL